MFPNALNLNPHDLESAARALAKVIEHVAGVMPTVTRNSEASRQVQTKINGVRVDVYLEETEHGHPLCRSYRLESPAEHFGTLEIRSFTGMSINSARLLTRAIVDDVRNNRSKLPHTYQAVDAIRDEMYSHSLAIIRTTLTNYQPSLERFFGVPTHKDELQEQGVRFTYFHAIPALVGGRLDIYEYAGPEGKQVVCQIIAPNSPWHGRYSRIVRNDTELEHLAEIIKRAAESSPFHDMRLRVMAQKMDYREIPMQGLKVFEHLRGRSFRLWCGIDGEETRIVRRQLRRRAQYTEDYLLVRRGLPVPTSIRRVFDLVHQANGLCSVKMIVHRGDEFAVQLIRTAESGANGCTLWWDKHTSADVGGKIISTLGALSALLAEPLGTLKDFSRKVRTILAVPPSGFSFSDRGETHSDLKTLEEILKRNSSPGLQSGSYQPIDYTEALYNIIAGLQIRWTSFANSVSYAVEHSPAQTRGSRVVKTGSLVITGPNTQPFTLPTPLSKDNIARLETKIKALAELGGGTGHTLAVNNRGRQSKFISGLQLKLSAKLLTSDSEDARFESLICKVNSSSRETVIQFDGVKAKISARGSDQATIALKSVSRPSPRPRGLVAMCRWLIKGAMTKIIDLRPDDIKIKLNGSINWSAVSVVCKHLAQFLRQECSSPGQESDIYQGPPLPSDQVPVFTGIGEGSAVFGGFGWSCSYSLSKGIYTIRRAFAASTTVLTEIVEHAPTAGLVKEDVTNCLSNRWLK